MPVGTKQRATIVVDQRDPMQSLTNNSVDSATGTKPTKRPSVAPPPTVVEPCDSVGSRLDAELDRIAVLTEQLAAQAAAESFRPTATVAEPIVGAPGVVQRSSAREAWSAVALLVLFVVAGFAWTSTRITTADRQLASLGKQLEEKQTAIIGYQQQIKTLRKQLADVETELKRQRFQQPHAQK